VPQPRKRRRGRRVRLRRDEAIAGGSAIALFVLLFFPWYDQTNAESKLSLPEASDATAWAALELVAPLLALACVLTLAAVLARLLRLGWRPVISPGAMIAVLGGLATLLVLFRIGAPPDPDGLVGIEYEATPSLAAFLGLAAALGIAVGGYRSMRAEGSSFAAVADSLKTESRQREDRGREGKDAGRPSKRAH
jgi:hypothetical protein